MIDPSAIDLASLPSLPLSDRRSFPKESCIYFVRDFLGQVHYVGGTQNLKVRFYSHHRQSKFDEIGEMVVSYMPTPIKDLDAYERMFLRMFLPPLNADARFHRYHQGHKRKFVPDESNDN